MDKEKDVFIDKTTSLKTVERVKFDAIPFAKGYKVKVSIAFNPEDSMNIDQLLEGDKSKNDILLALQGFITNYIEGELKGHLIIDE